MSTSLYMCVIHSTAKPIKKEDEGKVLHREEVHFVDRLPRMLLQNATYVVDLCEWKMVKDRFNMSAINDTMMHFIGNYLEKVKEAVFAFEFRHGSDYDLSHVKAIIDEFERAEPKPPESDT